MSRKMWGERWRGERWRGERDVREMAKGVNEIMKRWERGER